MIGRMVEKVFTPISPLVFSFITDYQSISGVGCHGHLGMHGGARIRDHVNPEPTNHTRDSPEGRDSWLVGSRCGSL